MLGGEGIEDWMRRAYDQNLYILSVISQMVEVSDMKRSEVIERLRGVKADPPGYKPSGLLEQVCIENRIKELEKALLMAEVAKKLQIRALTTMSSDMKFCKIYNELCLEVPEWAAGEATSDADLDCVISRIKTQKRAWEQALEDMEIDSETEGMIRRLLCQ